MTSILKDQYSDMPGCCICGGKMHLAFKTTVLNKYFDVAFGECGTCGFLSASDPFWLKEAYSEAIADTDTGVVTRNVHNARRVTPLLHYMFPNAHQRRFLDIAGGYGIFTRLMRDNGFDFYWCDEYCSNIFAKGFEGHIDDTSLSGATAFEVIEHLPNPREFIAGVFENQNIQALIFSTQLFSGKPPRVSAWCYYAFDTGQHISFFQLKTLQRLAAELGLRLFSCGDLHVLSRRRLSHPLIRLLTGRSSHLITPLIRRYFGTRLMLDSEHHKTLVAGSHTLNGGIHPEPERRAGARSDLN